ncbi:peptide ABC transporter substrate-binding protein [Egicoccus halophilus]|uniref:Peptide ABC transporter substrate-binding protein n=2 Tax=Egicoccus halophilus TaxID=1670830 RepID=A0A8J3A8D3_9ACTN|nr:peptide ABC transporter substrate-binding protein [Egicoccus halophilus]
MGLIMAAALVATACGNGGDEPPATEEPETVEPETTDEDTDEDTGDTDEEAAGDPVEGGTVLFGDEQEPTILNGTLIDGNSLVTSKVFNNIFPGAYTIQPDFSYAPWLIDGEAEFTEDPFSVTYTIRDDANWSDGTPITAEDFVFTLSVYDEDAAWADQITSRAGYELITDSEVEDDKTVTFDFSEPYAAWQLLFANVFPAHEFEGEDWETFMNDEIPAISGGPYLFDSWDRGTQLRLVRNDEYWDEDVMLDEIIMRYVPDTTTLTQQMVGGELDMYDPQPQIELVQQLDGATDRVNYEVGLGPVWEHIDFNTLVDGLDQEYVRQAISLGINREQIVDTLVRPVDPEAVVLNNPFWMANSEFYEPVFEQNDYDPDAARSLPEDNGCTEGDDGIYECDGTRLEFRISTTGGNERRELTQQLIQADLQQVGISINIENDEGATFFERLNTPENCGGVCDYDIGLFAWVGSPDPSGNANIYGCDGDTLRPQNWTAWCNQEITDLMDDANATVEPEDNAALWNEAAQVFADEVPVVPLFQQPQLLAWENTITGPELNATNQTQFWNSASWARTE